MADYSTTILTFARPSSTEDEYTSNSPQAIVATVTELAGSEDGSLSYNERVNLFLNTGPSPGDYGSNWFYKGQYRDGFILEDGDSGNNIYFSNASLPSGSAFTVSRDPFPVCYCTGTLIRTADGDVPVEDLRIGDTVVTASGAHRPIRWIGTRSYAPRFANTHPNLLPVRLLAGALADGIPARDLRVSRKHAMLLDGVLIPAEHLVNGRTILQEQRVDELTYWHVELDSHDVLLAEGAAAESFVDDEGRGIFHNAHTFAALYPDAVRREAVYCAPRVEDGYVLEAVRRRLAERAALPVPAARRFGELRGRVEGCDGTVVWGWAQDTLYPDAPVCLDVVVDGAVVALAYANRPGPDGVSAHGFRARLPAGLTAEAAGRIVVRRSADGVVLAAAAAIAAAA